MSSGLNSGSEGVSGSIVVVVDVVSGEIVVSVVSDEDSAESSSVLLITADGSVVCSDVVGSALTIVVSGAPSVAVGSSVSVIDDEHAAVITMSELRAERATRRFITPIVAEDRTPVRSLFAVSTLKLDQ
jgi:hypothetical protein